MIDQTLLDRGTLLCMVQGLWLYSGGAQEMEHRIARAGGHRSDDEARALNARIADLSKLLETVSAEHNMLTTQVRGRRPSQDSVPVG